MTDASVPGREDQGVRVNAPHDFGEQDDHDFEIKMESATEESSSLRAVSSAASTKTSAPKQDSETVQESLDRNVRFGRVCCEHSQRSSAEVSENQGVRAVTVAPGSTVQGVPVRKDQGVTKAGCQEAELQRTSSFAPNSEELSLGHSAQELVSERAASDAATPSDVRSRASLDDCCDNLDEKFNNNVSKSSNLLKKSAYCTEVEGVISVGAHGTAQKASVPMHHPVTEVGISEVKLRRQCRIYTTIFF